MKREISLLLIAAMLLTFVACDANAAKKPPAEGTSSQAQATGQGGDSTPKDAEKNRETVSTEFTVEIYPAVGSSKPVDHPLKTFSLEMPKNWIAEKDEAHQYVYHEGDNEFPLAIIKGDRQVPDAEKPFADLYEKYSTTVSITEITSSSYPVLRHVIKEDSANTPYYAYAYYVFAGDGLIMIELRAFDNSPQTQESFDRIISSFTVK